MIRFMGCEIGKSGRQGDLRNFHGGRGLRCLRGGGCSPTQGFKTGTVMTLMTVCHLDFWWFWWFLGCQFWDQLNLMVGPWSKLGFIWPGGVDREWAALCSSAYGCPRGTGFTTWSGTPHILWQSPDYIHGHTYHMYIYMIIYMYILYIYV